MLMTVPMYFSFSQYDKAKEQAKLHKQFDMQLASGVLDPYVRRIRSSKVRTMMYTSMPAHVALCISEPIY